MKTRRTLVVSAVLFAALGISAASAATNLVINGGFEQFDVGSANGFLADRDLPTILTAWSTTPDPANFSNNIVFGPGSANLAGATRFDGVQFGLYSSTTSPDGGNFVALDADPNGNAAQALTQTINGLHVNQQYTVSFDWAGAQYNFINGADHGCPGCWSGPTTDQIAVSFGGSTQYTDVAHVAAQGLSDWKKQSFTFTATSGTEVLSFLAAGTPEGLPPVALLDGVSVAAVPEPATWAMFLVGFGLLGAAIRRRRADAVTA